MDTERLAGDASTINCRFFVKAGTFASAVVSLKLRRRVSGDEVYAFGPDASDMLPRLSPDSRDSMIRAGLMGCSIYGDTLVKAAKAIVVDHRQHDCTTSRIHSVRLEGQDTRELCASMPSNATSNEQSWETGHTSRLKLEHARGS